jgi:hypothetical protein
VPALALVLGLVLPALPPASRDMTDTFGFESRSRTDEAAALVLLAFPPLSRSCTDRFPLLTPPRPATAAAAAAAVVRARFVFVCRPPEGIAAGLLACPDAIEAAAVGAGARFDPDPDPGPAPARELEPEPDHDPRSLPGVGSIPSSPTSFLCWEVPGLSISTDALVDPVRRASLA